jgi:hypothetical protein
MPSRLRAGDGKLDADVARIIFAVDKGRAGGLLDGGEFGERELLAVGRGHEQVGDLDGIGAVLRLHAHDKVEEFFTLDHLRGSLPADCSLHDRLDIGNVDAVARDFRAIDIVDDQTGLAELADHRELGVAGSLVQNILDLDGFFLQDFEVRAEDFDGQRGLEAGQGFVDGVLGGLCEIEDDAGISVEFFLQVSA